MADGGDVLTGGTIEPRLLEEEMRSSYLDYAMSVIVGCAVPHVRDGLKPVHRRVLYAMNDAGLTPSRGHAKCARIVGEVMGNFHPHGDQAIYDTLVRMAQDFSMRYPLIDGQGNFGSMDNDPAAAMRYTEARLARLAAGEVGDIGAENGDFNPKKDRRRLRRLQPELRRAPARARRPPGALPQPAGERVGGDRGRHGHEHPAAQPA